MYYLFGRYLSVDEIKNYLTQTSPPSDEIRSKIVSLGGLINVEQFEFAQNYEQYWNELVYLWRQFYQQCYVHVEPVLSPLWEQASERLKAELKTSSIEKVVRSYYTITRFQNSFQREKRS